MVFESVVDSHRIWIVAFFGLDQPAFGHVHFSKRGEPNLSLTGDIINGLSEGVRAL